MISIYLLLLLCFSGPIQGKPAAAYLNEEVNPDWFQSARRSVDLGYTEHQPADNL